jgi:microcystin-dependent protein
MARRKGRATTEIVGVAPVNFPTGSVLQFAGTVAPEGWLLCDGSAVSRTTYAALYAVLLSAHGNGDGVDTFHIPDLRGRFVRGVDGTANRDPDKGSRTAANSGGNIGNNVGSVQDDAMQQITGSFSVWVRNSGGSGAFNTPTASAGNVSNTGNVTLTNNGPTTNFDSSNSPSAKTSSESRGKNVNLNYIIKT